MWFSERTLHDSGAVAHSLEQLREQGHLFEADGALWMRTTDFGDDKDRVLIRSNGELTYFACDTAYYVDKRERGFDRCIYLLGADHHGYVGRLRAMAACAGDDPERNIEVLIGQLVKILQGGEELRLSKRAGTIVTLAGAGRDLIGVDALRYSLARYPADSPLTLDVDRDHQAEQRQPGLLRAVRPRPVCRRSCATPPTSGSRRRRRDFDPALLIAREGGRPAARAGRVPAGGRQRRPAARAAPGRALPRGHRRRLPQVLRHLPGAAAWATRSRADLHRARLLLVAATRTVLANGLGLLGVSAPERM